jgi:hypothetical protein
MKVSMDELMVLLKQRVAALELAEHRYYGGNGPAKAEAALGRLEDAVAEYRRRRFPHSDRDE